VQDDIFRWEIILGYGSSGVNVINNYLWKIFRMSVKKLMRLESLKKKSVVKHFFFQGKIF